MKHITEKYGMAENLLTLTHEELKELEPFLKALGIRCRATISDSAGVTIQAENPYKTWAGHPDTRVSDIKQPSQDDLRGNPRFDNSKIRAGMQQNVRTMQHTQKPPCILCNAPK